MLKQHNMQTNKQFLGIFNCSHPVVFLIMKEYTNLIVLLQRHVSTSTSHYQAIFIIYYMPDN